MKNVLFRFAWGTQEKYSRNLHGVFGVSLLDGSVVTGKRMLVIEEGQQRKTGRGLHSV